jgi:hypothetical protein
MDLQELEINSNMSRNPVFPMLLSFYFTTFCFSCFQAAEAKILRVSVSSFYDYLSVSLKCLQEFDASL